MTAQRPILFTAFLLLTALASLPARGQSVSLYGVTLKTSCPASCRDVTSKKPIGTYSHIVTYRYEVDMNAWDTTGNYIPDYDFMRLEISPDGLSRYYSTTADRRDSIMYRARTDANHRDGVDLDSWKPAERFALYEDTYLNWPEAGELTVRTGMVKEEFEYILEGRNLIGTGTYNQRTYSDITNFQYLYRLRPLSVMFKIRFSLG